MLTYGLERDPETAIARTLEHVTAAHAAAGCVDPFRFTAAFTDGRRVYAARYSTDGKSPTLFYGCGTGVRAAVGGDCSGDQSGADSLLVLSEPLDTDTSHWTAVPEASLLIADHGDIDVRRLELRLPQAA